MVVNEVSMLWVDWMVVLECGIEDVVGVKNGVVVG